MKYIPCTLALDLATSTGWAIYKDGEIVSGVCSFAAGGAPDGKTYSDFMHFLNRFNGVERVCFENVDFKSYIYQNRKYGGFRAILLAWVYDNRIAESSVHVKTLKKFFAGHGHADKDAMIFAAKSRGFDPINDDEADALAVLAWCLETNYGVYLKNEK